MTRVLLVHEFPGGFGGAERYLELLAAGLTDSGHAVDALLFGGGAQEGAAVARRLAAVSANTEIVAGRARRGPVREAVRRHEPDVLHWNFVDPFAFRGAVLVALPWGRPSVITDHLPMQRNGRHYELTRAVANGRIAGMIVVGDAGGDAARSHWRNPPEIHVVPNGVPQVDDASVRADPGGRPLRLLFVGRLTDQKGCLDLPGIVDALDARGVPPLLTVVGDGPDREELERRLGRSSLAEEPTFTGFVADPAEHLRQADVLLAPSRFEGLPFTPLEARAHGLPAVLSDIPAHRELAVDGAVALASTGDPIGWAEAVLGLAAALPAASRAALDAAQGHPVEAMVSGTVAVYRSVLD